MRKKLDKVAEVKRLSNIIRGIQTEISKQEEKLSELKRYRMFIDQLTPAKYRKSKKKRPEQARSVTSETSSVNTEKNGKGSRASNTKNSAASMNRRDSVRKDSRATTSMTKISTQEEIIEDESSDDEEIELYFKVMVLNMSHNL